MSNFIKFMFIMLLGLALAGCEKMPEDLPSKETRPKTAVYKKPKGNKHAALWERVRKNFDMTPRRKQAQEQQRIQQFVKHYHGNDEHLAKITTKASPYLHFIVEELEKRDMPGELALLPMIESGFEPQATSRKGAAGLWQFIPGTGRQFGLKQDKWYDGRRDVVASTRAALDYLQMLHKEFDGNWMLALAAYNAGPGNVHRAIKKNQKKGEPTNYWSLKLPKETQQYVPKFLALAEVVANPKKHEVTLPHIENKPYFVAVDPGKQYTFKKVAKLADIDEREVKRLNPGYRKASTHPKGPKKLLLPIKSIETFESNMARIQ